MRLVVLVFAPTLAAAQTLHLEQAGRSLAIDGPCAVAVVVATDPALSGRVVMDAKAARDDELSPLRLHTDGDRVVLSRSDTECPEGEETLRVRLRVPPRMPLAIDDSGGGSYELPDVLAPLSVESSGSLTVTAGRAGPLSVDLSGSGTVRVAGLIGAAHVAQSGSGAVEIGGGSVPALELDASGSGRFRYGPGSIGALELSSSGNADVAIEATVGTASFDVSGSGTVRVKRVTGPVSQDEEGSARLVIENR